MKRILAILICAATLALSVQGAGAATFAECDAYARQVANDNVAKRTVGTAVVGTLLGLGIGAAQGNNLASSAAVGAGAGGVAGLAVGSVEWEKIYNAALEDCMGGSQTTNTGSQTGLYEPWTDEWFEYCKNKYVSFDETDGTFQPFEGPRRLCR
jgi:hypothetical protein